MNEMSAIVVNEAVRGHGRSPLCDRFLNLNRHTSIVVSNLVDHTAKDAEDSPATTFCAERRRSRASGRGGGAVPVTRTCFQNAFASSTFVGKRNGTSIEQRVLRATYAFSLRPLSDGSLSFVSPIDRVSAQRRCLRRKKARRRRATPSGA
jgi:hypothetical protein